MHEFFIPKSNVKGKIAIIEKDDFHHLVNVLRAKIGEKFFIVVDRGEKYISKLIEIKDKVAKLYLEEKINESFEPKINIYLAQSLPKGKKFEDVLRVSTELGVKGIYPLITERTVFKPDSNKLERYKKIVKEEAQVSKRDIIPQIYEPIKFCDFLNKEINFDKKLIFWELELEKSIDEIDFKENENVLIVVGNEGGFSLKEIELAKERGFISLSLGKRILRTEIAPIVILSIILYKAGEFKR
ncbi:MAG: 16S rRNA (uracil(1498)-N(3))-methyltransferase [Caldisericia bacterium]|nr:16S rRNA (uracil(1498)-N(3))-methyltransferase [Caldisericia bacterium]